MMRQLFYSMIAIHAISHPCRRHWGCAAPGLGISRLAYARQLTRPIPFHRRGCFHRHAATADRHALYAKPCRPPHRSYDDLDLLAALPDFSPAGERANQLPLETLLTITLRPKVIRLEPRDKVARLFARYLDAQTIAGDAGLVMRRFQQSSPFPGEEIFMTPPEGRLFWARCSPASSEADAQRRICLSEMRYSALDLRLRFSATHLTRWEQLTASTSQLLASLSR